MTLCRALTEIVNRNPEKFPTLFEFTRSSDQLLICLADSAVEKPRIPSAYSILSFGLAYWQLSGITKSTLGGFIIGLIQTF
jgi:hypothetical protein